MYLKRVFTLLALAVSSVPALAGTKVVATTGAMGMLAREVGGDAVEVTVLAPPNRDAQHLDARPSFIRALRGADLVVAVGADLEVGWLPPALSSAANPPTLPGREGYFEAAAQVPLLEAGERADRAMGDVHPAGNPHVNMDPVRMAAIAKALADRLGRLDSVHAEDFRSRAGAFGRAVETRLPGWKQKTRDAPGAVLYHKDAIYLLDRLEVPVLGYVEPVPGVPPTAAHLKGLTEKLRGRAGVVLYTVYQEDQAPQTLAESLGWSSVRLPLDPPTDASAEGYLELIDRWVTALAGGKP